MSDFFPSTPQERERLKIKLAQAELTAQLNGTDPARGTSFGPPYCPTMARQRHQQRLANITALCASVAVLTQEM